MYLDIPVLLLLAVFFGALLQVGIGIGFSILVGPIIFVQIGTASGVPLLLLLNIVVSAVATPGSIKKTEHSIVARTAIASTIGIGIGILIYQILSEAMVLAIAGGLLILAALSTFLPVSNWGKRAFLPVSGLSGLATVWAATPGPLMALSLILAGFPAEKIRTLVQPIALIGYSVAFGLHMLATGYKTLDYPQVIILLGIAVCGSIAGRKLGPYLPQSLITNGIRGLALLAGVILILRATELW